MSKYENVDWQRMNYRKSTEREGDYGTVAKVVSPKVVMF